MAQETTTQNMDGLEEQYISNEEIYVLNEERHCERCGVRLDVDDTHLCKKCDLSRR